MTLLPEFWIQTLGWTLVHSLWQLALVAVVLRLLLWMIPRQSSRFRYLLSVAALIVGFGALLYTGYRVHQPDTLSSPSPAVIQTTHVATPSPVIVSTPATSWRSTLEKAEIQLQAWLSPHLSGMLVLWFSGMLFFLLRTLGKVAYLHRLTRKDTHPLLPVWDESVIRLKTALSIRRQVLIQASTRIRTPFVVGFFKPVILLPLSTCTQLSYEQLEAILAHELAHIRRWDDVINWLQAGMEIVLFYHPATWWISQCIRDEREKCCDDVAVAACGNALEYAKALAHMESLQQSTPDLTLAFARQGAGLLARIERLLQPTAVSSRASVAPAVVTGLLLLSFLISYRMTSTYSSPADTNPAPLYSGAILSIPQLQGVDTDVPSSLSPWQPRLPDWLAEEESFVLDTLPEPEKAEDPTPLDKEEHTWYRIQISPDSWTAEVDTLLPWSWEFTDSLDHIYLPSLPDMVNDSMMAIMADSALVWKSDSAFQFQFHFPSGISDTIFPLFDHPGIFNVPMPPMPDVLIMPDSSWEHSLHFYEDALEGYDQLFEQLDSAGYWDRLTEQQQRLEEQQQHYESWLHEREEQHERQLEEWQQRLEEWESRQKEQLRQYEEQVREWKERTQEQLQQQQEQRQEQLQRQQERQQEQLQRQQDRIRERSEERERPEQTSPELEDRLQHLLNFQHPSPQVLQLSSLQKLAAQTSPPQLRIIN